MGLRSVAAALLVITTVVASTSEKYGPEDDEDMSISGNFALTFKVSVNCNGSWYSNNVLLFMDLLRNSIIEGIREDCAECNFHERHLKEEVISCQPREHGVHFQAKIYNWASTLYPVPFILGTIKVRYGGNDPMVLIVPTANFSKGSFESSDDLELNVIDVNTDYTMVGSGDFSGDGLITTTTTIAEITTEEVTESVAFGANDRPRCLSTIALCFLAACVLTAHELLLH